MAVLVLVTVPTLVWMLGPGATWVLEHIDHVTVFAEDKDRAAALAAIRGNVLAVATGLAAMLAVFYTARNADTARRTFQLGERGHDTDRFSKAVEQLGSGQAPVRLGGLYALEQLAQNNPALRQTIVDVICAYLRMPWTPPDAKDRHQQVRAAQRAARTPASGRAQARAGRDPDEERQVRLTAQRLLTDHLRCYQRRWWQRRTAVNQRYWPGISLDLTGAVLISLELSCCRMHRAHFSEALFTGDADFMGATFTGDAWFNGAIFTGTVRFNTTTFTRLADFKEARFTGIHAYFNGATFTGEARFNGATFTSHADFDGATFANYSRFDGTAFTGGAQFTQAAFVENPGFNHTRNSRIYVANARVAGREWRTASNVVTGPTGEVLKPTHPPDDGAKDEHAGGGPTASS
ncbi:pentapeptide repeat-containing protein [Nonomuraea sp. NPDC004186]